MIRQTARAISLLIDVSQLQLVHIVLQHFLSRALIQMAFVFASIADHPFMCGSLNKKKIKNYLDFFIYLSYNIVNTVDRRLT